MKAIRTHADAYAVAAEMAETMNDGEMWGLNVLNVTHIGDGEFTVQGKPGTFRPSELADLILFPERKRANDWLRTYKMCTCRPARQYDALGAWLYAGIDDCPVHGFEA